MFSLWWKFFSILLAIVWLSGFLVLILRVFGVFFIPSHDLFFPGPPWGPWVLGALLGLPLTSFFISEAAKKYKAGKIKAGLTGIATSLFGIFLNGFVMIATCNMMAPMIYTAFVGQSGYIDYTVTNLWASSRTCYKAVEVNVDVMMFSAVCNIPDAMRHDGLREGSIIRVFGKTSTAGVFYKRFQIIDSESNLAP